MEERAEERLTALGPNQPQGGRDIVLGGRLIRKREKGFIREGGRYRNHSEGKTIFGGKKPFYLETL